MAEKRVYRIDRRGGRLTKARPGPAGSVRVDANLTRGGIFRYRNPDGSERVEYRPPEEVFKADSLASMEGVPVTIGHPDQMVSALTIHKLRHGYVVDGSPRQDGDHVVATLQLETGLIQGRVDSGDLVEISMGYTVTEDWTPGTAPCGTDYHLIQRNPRYNHAAVGPENWGRAGNEARMRLDGNGDVIFPEEKTDQKEAPAMEIEIDGKRFEKGSDAHIAYVTQRADSKVVAAEARADKAEADAQAATERADKAEARADKAEADAKEAASPERIDSLVAERTRIVTKAAGIIGEEAKFDGKSNHDIMIEAIEAHGTELSAERKDSADYVGAYFDAIAETAKTESSWDKTRRQDSKKNAKDKQRADGEDQSGGESERKDQKRKPRHLDKLAITK